MKRAVFTCAVAVALALAPSKSDAQTVSLFAGQQKTEPNDARAKQLDTTCINLHLAEEAGTFTTIGSPGRMWELRSDTGFGELRALTERVELARFLTVSGYERPRGWECGPKDAARSGVVLRVSFGIESQTTTGFYTPQGPMPAVGFRVRSLSDNEWLELGLRLLVPYPGPSHDDVQLQHLALNSVLTSGAADDGTWLTFDSFAPQIYMATQARLNPTGTRKFEWSLGFDGGLAATFVPISSPTALGSFQGFVANIYVDFFFNAWRILDRYANLQIGAHGEASLSSFWPGPSSAPIILNGFVGWSPAHTIALRLFYGYGFTPVAFDPKAEYGARLQLFF